MPKFNLEAARSKTKKGKIKNKRLYIDEIKNKEDYREEPSDHVK